MDLCSILLQVRPEYSITIQDQIREWDGVEIHAVSPGGRMIVTVEGDEQNQFTRTILDLRGIDGMIAANLVYHFHEDDFEDDLIESHEEEMLHEAKSP